MPSGSYTTSLFADGKARIAQKVGEEGIELALARMKDDQTEIANEAEHAIIESTSAWFSPSYDNTVGNN